MQIYIIIGIIAILLIIFSFIFFKRYASGLISDYFFDAILSFSDNFLAGAGVAGFDIGDWIGATFIFFRERKITGNGPALFVAWEATNFLPLSFIPIIGEGIEIATGFFPAATISRIFFNKFKEAENSQKKLKEDISLAEKLGFKSKEDKTLEKIKNLIDSNPLKSISLSTNSDKDIEDVLTNYHSKLIIQSNQLIKTYSDQISKTSSPQEFLDELNNSFQEANSLIEQSKQLIIKKDFEKAIELSYTAEQLITKSTQEFNKTLENYRERFN